MSRLKRGHHPEPYALHIHPTAMDMNYQAHNDLKTLVQAGANVIVDGNTMTKEELLALVQNAKGRGGNVTVRGAARLAQADLVSLARFGGVGHVTLDFTS